jgi:hypothetical protein
MARRPDLGYFADGADLLDPGTYERAVAPFGQAEILPAAAFRSLEFALLEDEAIWTRDWICIGTLADIPQPGDLLPFSVGNHGIHVQHMEGGRLEGRFNNAQHGGCRFVPVQCQGGTRTKCSFTSCGYSRDRDAIAASDGASSVAAMHQYVGLRPERLLQISVATIDALIFVNVDGCDKSLSADPAMEELIALLLAGKPDRLGKRWLEFNGNWKLVAQALLGPSSETPPDVANTFVVTRTTDNGEEIRAIWLFPNLVIVASESAACTILLQQTALEKTLCRVQMWGEAHSAQSAAEARSLLDGIEAAGGLVVSVQESFREPRLAPEAGIIQQGRAGYWAQRLLIERLMVMPRLDHQAPMFHPTKIYSI